MSTRPIHTYLCIPTTWAGFGRVPDTYAAPFDMHAADPVGQPSETLSLHGSAYIGHLVWRPGEPMGEKGRADIAHFAIEATVDFRLLLELAKRIEMSQQPLDPASAGLHQALHAIARKADEDRTFLHDFTEWCSREEKWGSNQLLNRIFTALSDIAVLDRHSTVYHLLESLAAFGVKHAWYNLRGIFSVRDQGIDVTKPDWRDHISLTVPLRSKIEKDPSIIEASLRKNDGDRLRDATAHLAAALSEGTRADAVSERARSCIIDANDHANLMARNIAQWIGRIKTLSESEKTTVIYIDSSFPKVNFEVIIDPHEIIINAIEQRAELATLKKGLRNLARIAPANPDALRYLVIFGKLDASYIADDILEKWDEITLAGLCEDYPIIFEELNYLANRLEYDKPKKAMLIMDVETLKNNWLNTGLPPETFDNYILPTLIKVGNTSAKHFRPERDDIDPHADRIIPFKKPDDSPY